MKYFRYSMNMKKLNFLCILFFIPLFILICFMGISKYMNFNFFVIYFFWLFLHELLHGIGFYLSGVSFNSIIYGACLEKGIFYCMCKERIDKKGIIISLLFPFFFIGVFTFFIGLFFENYILVLLSLFNIVGCVGDLCMFFSFVRLPDFKYVDLDDCTGFVLISDSDLSNYKLFCMDNVSSGNPDDLVSNNFKKINISKFSYIFFIVMLILLIIEFFV